MGHETVYEPLNPNNATTLSIMSALAQQSNLKVLLVNSWTSEVLQQFEILNTFAFDRLASTALTAIGADGDDLDFDKAMQRFTASHSLQDLLKSEYPFH